MPHDDATRLWLDSSTEHVIYHVRLAPLIFGSYWIMRREPAHTPVEALSLCSHPGF